jgi:hypothetical protein
MPTLAIKSGTTAIAGSTVKGSFSYFSGSTKDLGPTSSTGFYSGVDAPAGGYTVYQIGGLGGWTARVATDDASLNSILISAGGTGSTVAQNITWATNTNSVFINTGPPPTYTIGQSALGGVIAYIDGGGSTGTSGLVVAAAFSTGDGYDQWAPAFSISAAYTGGGYNNWRLPSADEMTNKLYPNKAATGGWSNNTYWSSTEYTPSPSYAYVIFADGSQTIYPKTYYNNFRAVRSF